MTGSFDPQRGCAPQVENRWFNSFDPRTTLGGCGCRGEALLLVPFQRQRPCSLEKLCHLLKITQLAGGWEPAPPLGAEERPQGRWGRWGGGACAEEAGWPFSGSRDQGQSTWQGTRPEARTEQPRCPGGRAVRGLTLAWAALRSANLLPRCTDSTSWGVLSGLGTGAQARCRDDLPEVAVAT